MFSNAFLPGGASAAEAPASPEFSLTIQDLRSLTKALPKAIQDRIITADYAPADLVALGAYPLSVKRADLWLRTAIMPDVLRSITRSAARLQREYFDDIQQYLLEFLHDNRTALEARRMPAR